MTVVDEGTTDQLSTQPERPTMPNRGGLLVGLRALWRYFTSMRTALLLLALLAVAAIPGTVLPQRGLDPVKVNDYIASHPQLGPFFDKLYLFDVFAAPWFVLIFALLFVSIVGCVVPRIRLHAKALRRRPPNAPRNLSKLRAATEWTTTESPAAVAERVRRHLRDARWRADIRAESDGAVTVAAEKGYLRETGNLVFHIALLLLLLGIAVGTAFGYKGTVLKQQRETFANGREAYDVFQPSRWFYSDSELSPFSFRLDRFSASYDASNGEPTDFHAVVAYQASPTAPSKPYDIRVNHPLNTGDAKVFLVGHGYSMDLRITNKYGVVVSDGDVPFLPDTAQFLSHGVLKVPHLNVDGKDRPHPGQLGLTGFFFPTAAVTPSGQLTSSFPGLNNPVLQLAAFKGDLGFSTGIPQSVYSLDVSKLKEIDQTTLKPGQSWKLSDGSTVKFVGIHQWATFQVAHQPGKTTVLVAAILIIAGLLGSLRVRRRRFWIRAVPVTGSGGTQSTVIQAAGLARTDVGGFVDELDELTKQLGRPTERD
ncbi:MAG: cytochrome c biogenesis protein ResB [Frankiaceae bacterium]|nr:cytochrome c biogenesis protein ResB [Frankiaceae bacterium]